MISVKFFVLPESVSERCYQHEIIQLAEGFKEIGIPFYGNCKYWYSHESGDYLIRDKKSKPASVNIFSSDFVRWNSDYEKEITNKKINILVDSDDGYLTIGHHVYNKFEFVLKCHMIKHINYPFNFKPWAFGLTNRIINKILESKKIKVKKSTLVNYRVYYDTRFLAKNQLDPLINEKYRVINWVSDPYKKHSKDRLINEKESASYWWQTGSRHDTKYYEKLNESSFTYCFGGPIVRKNNLIQLTHNSKIVNRIERRIGRYLAQSGKTHNLINYQYDSWRLWESLLSNTIPIHNDFENSGYILPINPENGIHYIGVKDYNFKNCAEAINELDSNEINNISENGYDFALKYYSPRIAAERFIDYIDSASI